MSTVGARAAKAHRARIAIVDGIKTLSERLGIEIDVDGALARVIGIGDERVANELVAIADMMTALVDGTSGPGIVIAPAAEAKPDPLAPVKAFAIPERRGPGRPRKER